MREFFSKVLKSFNPGEYDELAKSKTRSTIVYFFLIVLLAFILFALLSLPKVFLLSGDVGNKLDSFSVLDVSLEYEMKEKLVLTRNPLIIMDTTKEYTNIEEGKILITDDAVFYKPLIGKTLRITRQENFLEDTQNLANLLTLIFILTIPSLLVLGYLYFLIKFAVIIIIAVLLAFLIVRLARYGILFPELFKVAVYASTIMIVVELMTKAFVPSIFFIQYLLFLVYLVLGIVKAGQFEKVVKTKK